MIKVDGICRCGNKLTAYRSEFFGMIADAAAKQDVEIEPVTEVTSCTHCDSPCILNRKACSFCLALEDSDGDSEYYSYTV